MSNKYYNHHALVTDLRKQGAMVTKTKTGWSVTHKGQHVTTIHTTPSDVNVVHNLRRAIEKAGLSAEVITGKSNRQPEAVKVRPTAATLPTEYPRYMVKGPKPSPKSIDRVLRGIATIGEDAVFVSTLSRVTEIGVPNLGPMLYHMGWRWAEVLPGGARRWEAGPEALRPQPKHRQPLAQPEQEVQPVTNLQPVPTLPEPAEPIRISPVPNDTVIADLAGIGDLSFAQYAAALQSVGLKFEVHVRKG